MCPAVLLPMQRILAGSCGSISIPSKCSEIYLSHRSLLTDKTIQFFFDLKKKNSVTKRKEKGWKIIYT